MSLVFFLTGWGSAILVADFADSYWLSATVYYSEVENNGVKTPHTHNKNKGRRRSVNTPNMQF